MGRWREMFDLRLRRILRDSSLLLIAAVTAGGLGLVNVVIVTRLLGAEQYGKLAVIMAISQSVRQFLGVRIWEWTMKEVAHAHIMKDAAHAAAVVRRGLFAGLMVNILAFVAVAVAAPFAAMRFVHDASTAVLVVGYGAVLLVSWPNDVAFAVLRVGGRFRAIAGQQIAMAALRIVVTGGSVILWRSLAPAVVAYVLSEIVASLWSSWTAARAFRYDFGVSFWRARERAGARVAMARLVIIGSVMDTLKLAATRVDVLVLGWCRTPVAVANYQAAWNFIDLAQRVTQPFTMVTFADLAKLGAAGQGREIVRVVGKLSLLALAVMLPACTALYLLAPLLCNLVYGPGYPGAPALLQVLAYSLLWLTGLWLLPSFVSVGKPAWGLQVVGTMTAVKVLLLALLAPSMGEMGVAIANLAYALSVPLLMPIYYVRMRRWVSSPEFAARQAPPPHTGEAAA